MVFVILGFWLAVLGAIIWLWVLLASSGRRVRALMAAALVLWPLPFAGIYIAIPCLSGHCHPSPLEEIAVPSLILGSPIGILLLLVVAALKRT